MVLDFLTSRELEKTTAIVKSYYYSTGLVDRCPLNVLADWCYAVEIQIYYHAGILYFQSKEDLLAFELRWC